MNNSDKKIDNKIYEVKEKINIINENIYNEKSKLKYYDDLEERFGNVKKNFYDIIKNLKLSIKGKRINRIIQNIDENNQLVYKNIIFNIEKEREKTKKNINKMYDKKNNLDNEMKKIYLESKNKENSDNSNK